MKEEHEHEVFMRLLPTDDEYVRSFYWLLHYAQVKPNVWKKN